MSKYEWERGEIVIPSAEWADFKKRIRDALNTASERQFDLANKLYEHIRTKHPKARGYELRGKAEDFVRAQSTAPSMWTPARYTPSDASKALESVIGWDTGAKDVKVRKPRKNMFPAYGINATTFNDTDCSLHFDNERRVAVWNVGENNRACETARAGNIGKAFFASLGKVKWTRGSGGTIIGNDEYNQDAGRDYEGGGGSYVVDRFGPDVKPPKASTGHGYVASSFGRRW